MLFDSELHNYSEDFTAAQKCASPSEGGGGGGGRGQKRKKKQQRTKKASYALTFLSHNLFGSDLISESEEYIISTAINYSIKM